MKQLIITIAALLLLTLTVTAQYEEDTETAVVYIVLIVGRVQPFIVVVVDVSTGLYQHIRFENEIPLLGSDCKTFFAV